MNSSAHQPAPGFSKRRLLFAATALASMLVVLIGLVAHFAKPLLAGPALTTLVVQGDLQHVTPEAVRAAVLPALGKGFFSTNVDAVKAAVQSVPWVASVAVRRGWPHTLYIGVTEEVPVARWNGSGLVDAQGRVFVRSHNTDYLRLPALAGPEGSAQDVLAEYNTFAALLAPRGLAIMQLTVDARGAASVQLSDGIEVRLGREAAEQRLARFAAIALPTLGAHLAAVAYVDMRYTNGFAVGWKTTPPDSAAKRGEVRSNV